MKRVFGIMNELVLSNDLNVITAEINSYKQVAGQTIFEIGRRLNHVKEKDLTHGEFGKWLESIEMNHRQANRFMRVANELPNSTTWSNLGARVLYEIATLPEKERKKEHELPSGEIKTPDEMTVRELQELKRELKLAEEAKEQAEKQVEMERRERERLEVENQKLANQEPKTVEVEKVVYKTDEEKISQLNTRIEQMSIDIEKTKMERQEMQNKLLTEQEKTKEFNQLKSKLEEKEEELASLSREQTRLKNRRTLLDQASYMSRDIGAWVRKIRHYIYERDGGLQGDPDANRAIESMVKTLNDVLNEVRSWQEVPTTSDIDYKNVSGEIVDIEYTDI